MLRLLRCAVALFALSSLVAAEDSPTILTVRREDATTLTFTAAEFAALPHLDLTAFNPHEKKEHHYAGVAVREILAKAGAPLGEKIRGHALQLGVVARAKDGYGVLFALAEFDETFSNRTLFIADSIDGQPLGAGAAPLQLIVPGDKRPTRWARMVTSLEIFSAPAPKP
jgi:hypothetical protein